MRNNLIELRKKVGLTQAEMGALFGKNAGYWVFIETGRRKGDPELWIDLGIKFNLTPKEIKKLMEVF